MVVKLFLQSCLDVFQACDLHLEKSLSDQERPLLKILLVSCEDLLESYHVIFKSVLLLVGNCSQVNKVGDRCINVNPLTWFVFFGYAVRRWRCGLDRRPIRKYDKWARPKIRYHELCLLRMASLGDSHSESRGCRLGHP